jgi:hypothetical protein
VNDRPQAPRSSVRYVMSLDMAYVNDQAVLSVCHCDGDGRVVLDRMHAWKGSRLRAVRKADVEATGLEAHRAYRCPKVLLDRGKRKAWRSTCGQRA